MKKSVTENALVYQVRQVCQQLSFAYARAQLLFQLDSILEGVYRSASARYQSGEAKMLEQTAADAQRNESKNRLRLNDAQIMRLRHQLKALLNSEFLPDLSAKELTELRNENPMDTSLLATNPSLTFSRQQINVAENETKLERAKFAPDLRIGYFNQTLIGSPDPETGNLSDKSDRFSGFQVGLAIPLWFGPHQGRVKAASFRQKQSQSEFEAEQRNLTSQLEQAFQQLDASGSSLNYYRTSALPNADRILKHALLGFREGDIDYAEYLLSMQGAMRIREGYLQALHDYNQSIIYIEFLSGNKSLK
jgi:cobalt-zinc-cadmium resistance protein CzcA